MKFNGGFLFLFVIVFGFSMLMGVLIAMPFDTEAKDSDDAYLTYHIDSIDVDKKNGTTNMVVTVYNHGYVNAKVGTYDFTYKTFGGNAGGVGRHIHLASTNIKQYICEDRSACSFELIFKTIDKGELSVQ